MRCRPAVRTSQPRFFTNASSAGTSGERGSLNQVALTSNECVIFACHVHAFIVYLLYWLNHCPVELWTRESVLPDELTYDWSAV